jgi:methylated-DNA-[protein]-cysteine S-methyltransferase
MAQNPIPIFIPCHRVIKSGGNLGQYGPGEDIKRKLLKLEGAI